jgi:carboxyl-terminal processing protease
MSLKVRAILVVAIGLVLGLSLSVGGGLIDNGKSLDKEELAWEQARLFAEVLERVKRDYVEPIDDAVLLESAIRGMVSDLDAHSQYLDAREYRDIRISTMGSYTGIGIEVDEVDGALHVVTPIAGSPAARSGIQSGDQIIAVDGVAIEADNLQQTIGRLRGHAGTKVIVTVLRDDAAIDHEMRRQMIRVASVHKEFVDPSFGYVRVSQFSENTARELGRAVDELQEANAAEFSMRPLMFQIFSWIPELSFRPTAGLSTRGSLARRIAATYLTELTWSCSSIAVQPRPPRLSRVPCRITIARW